MTATRFNGHVVRATLGGPAEQRAVVDRLLSASPYVHGHAIDEDGRVIAYVDPGLGEIDFVAAVSAAGMYPLETYYQDMTDTGGYRAC